MTLLLWLLELDYRYLIIKKGLKGFKWQKSSLAKTPLFIYQSIRLNELITNIYGFYMIKLYLNEISGFKGPKIEKITS